MRHIGVHLQNIRGSQWNIPESNPPLCAVFAVSDSSRCEVA
jgi:hypothetical protein